MFHIFNATQPIVRDTKPGIYLDLRDNIAHVVAYKRQPPDKSVLKQELSNFHIMMLEPFLGVDGKEVVGTSIYLAAGDADKPYDQAVADLRKRIAL